jgi:hypothetical protein
MHASQHFHAINTWHIDIAKQDVHVSFFELAQGSFTVRSSLNTITQPLQLLL